MTNNLEKPTSKKMKGRVSNHGLGEVGSGGAGSKHVDSTIEQEKQISIYLTYLTNRVCLLCARHCSKCLTNTNSPNTLF